MLLRTPMQGVTSVIQNIDFSSDVERIKQSLLYTSYSLNFIIMNLELWEYLNEVRSFTKKFSNRMLLHSPSIVPRMA